MVERVLKAVPLGEYPDWVKVGGFYTDPSTLYNSRLYTDPVVFWKYHSRESSVLNGTTQLFEEYRGRKATWSDGIDLVNAVGEYAYIELDDLEIAKATHNREKARKELHREMWPEHTDDL